MKKAMTFEQAMDRLEEISRLLEEETLSLDSSLELYAEAAKLVKTCTARLEAARKKIEVAAGEQIGENLE